MTIRQAEQILNITTPYDCDDLSKHYRECAKKAHPDLGGSEQQMKDVNEAYEFLKPLFDGSGAGVKRSPMTEAESARYQRSVTGNSVTWTATEDIPISDFVEILEQILREEERRQAVVENMTAQTRNEETIINGFAERERAAASSEPKPMSFRYKAARFFEALTHMPYGIAAFCFLEWQVLSSERTLTSMFDGVGMLFDIIFEAIIIAPLLAFAIRTGIRGVLRAIARALDR